MKKATLICVATALIAMTFILTGCTTGVPGTSPSPTIGVTHTPGVTVSPEGTATTEPELSPSPGTTGNETIPGFQEGTAVQPAEVPEIVNAIETKYAGAAIESIKHALHMTKEVYEVVFKLGNETKTVYVSPNGAEVTEAEATGNPATT